MADGTHAFDAAELEAFIEKYMELDRGVQRPKGLYSILPLRRERSYQRTLKYFLDPQQPHGFGYALLEAFLECIGFHEFNLRNQHIEIDEEVYMGDPDAGGRIDLVICGGSALADRPRWAVFLELKVGASEGNRQTTNYATTDRWSFNWFESNAILVDRLEDTRYVYLTRNTANPPADATGTFVSKNWSEIVEHFETAIQDAVFDYPHRSVVQFTDFIRSLKETEGMDSSIDESELSERLNLYFEHRDLIQQIEQANSQFESDFEDLGDYLQDNWEAQMSKHYDFEDSGWRTSPSTNPKWQGILPAYWAQDPLNQRSTIKLYFRHAPTTDSLRERRLTFRLRLPSARNVHTEPYHEGRSFNDVFAENCTGAYAARINEALETLDVDGVRLGSASALVEKHYPLDPHHLASSYFDRLDTAIDAFCSHDAPLLEPINAVFEDTYETVFGEPPAGTFPGPLPKRG